MQKGKLTGKSDFIEGEKIGGYVDFPTTTNEIRKMKVAISYVSEAQARLNLEKELNHWDFDKVVAESRTDWNNWLQSSLQRKRHHYQNYGLETVQV